MLEGRRVPLKRRAKETEYAKVKRIDQSTDSETEATERSVRRLEREIKRTVDQFLESTHVQDLARMNDAVLREYMRVPAEGRRSAQYREMLFGKMRRASSERFSEIRADLTKTAEGADKDRAQVAKRRLDNLPAAEKEMDLTLRGLESSVFQLSRFIDRESVRHPDRLFGTSVFLDVEYGIDLIAADQEFDAEQRALIVNLVLYQAKASREGLSEEHIRDLPGRYGSDERRARRELVLDPQWFQREVIRNLESGLTLSDEEAFDLMANIQSKLAATYQKLDTLPPAQRFATEMRVYNQVQALAEVFDVDVPDSIAKPQIRIGSIEMRYLVDTAKEGLQDLSANEARTYKEPAQHQREL